MRHTLVHPEREACEGSNGPPPHADRVQLVIRFPQTVFRCGTLDIRVPDDHHHTTGAVLMEVRTAVMRRLDLDFRKEVGPLSSCNWSPIRRNGLHSLHRDIECRVRLEVPPCLFRHLYPRDFAEKVRRILHEDLPPNRLVLAVYS